MKDLLAIIPLLLLQAGIPVSGQSNDDELAAFQTIIDEFCRTNKDLPGCQLRVKPSTSAEGLPPGSVAGPSSDECPAGTRKCQQLPQLCVPSTIDCGDIGTGIQCDLPSGLGVAVQSLICGSNGQVGENDQLDGIKLPMSVFDPNITNYDEISQLTMMLTAVIDKEHKLKMKIHEEELKRSIILTERLNATLEEKEELGREKVKIEVQKQALEVLKSEFAKQKTEFEDQKVEFAKQNIELEKYKTELEEQHNILQTHISELEKLKADLVQYRIQSKKKYYETGNRYQQNKDIRHYEQTT